MILLSFLNFVNAAAQQGLIDKTFNTTDDGVNGDGFDKVVRTIALQKDGKLLVGGDYLNFNGNSLPFISRLNQDGSVDDSFELNDGFNRKIEQIIIQNDGKIIAVGSFNDFNGNSIGRLVRLNNDGSLDATFDTSLGAQNNIVYGVTQQGDGKIIIVGSFTKFGDVAMNRIARVLSDGSVDTSFNIGTGASGLVREVCVQADGKIVVAGSFASFNGVASNKIARLNQDGSIDATFMTGTGFDDNVTALDVQADGKILVGGTFTLYDGAMANKIIRLNTDGSIDATFLSGTGFSNSSVAVIKAIDNGNIMVGGGFTKDYNGIPVLKMVMLKANGTINTLFDIGSGPATATVYAFTSAADGSWFVGGSFSVFNSQNRGRLAKLDANGVLDVDFLSSNVGFDNSVYKTLPLANSQTMIFGNFNSFNGIPISKAARLNVDGSLDTTFNTGKSGANNTVRTAVLQDDGKIIMAGGFTSYNGNATSKLVRLLADGSIDTSFLNGIAINNQIYAMVLQPDGKIVIAGSFTKYNDAPVNKIVRLLADGSLDASFNIGSGADGTIDAVVLQNDGKMIIAGRFLSFNGTNYNRLLRLNTDGSIDTSFDTGTGFDKNVYTLALQSDGKIIVGGIFQNFNGVLIKRLLRLTTNGSLDTSFISGTGLSNGTVRSLLVQPDDRILIGGTFTGKYDGYPVKRLARLLANGTYDSSFFVDLNNTLYSTSFTAKGMLMIGGNFNSVSGIAKHRVARIKLCTDNTVWENQKWSNGLPTIYKSALFNSDYIASASIDACSCSIALDKSVTITSDETFSLRFDYSGLGTLILENNASLYQDEDEIENTATAFVVRKTTPILKFDYTYWSSPVADHTLLATSPETAMDKFFSFSPISNSWLGADPAAIMKVAKGYIIRGPQSFSDNLKEIHEANFIGVPHNGKKTIALGTALSHNLIGNPYPSAIDADVFLQKNASVMNGTIYLWSHNTPITNNNYTSDDYAVYNLLGGVGTAPSISAAANTSKPNGKIASGQSFFVSSTTDSGVVEFDNSMRVTAENSQFFRMIASQNKGKLSALEKHRIWLNMYTDEGFFKQMLVGFIDGGTASYDHALDGESFNGNKDINFYSISGEKQLAIQAKGLPFENTEEIVLGYETKIGGNYKIDIDEVDGLFVDQQVYLKDNMNNKTHDLKQGFYSFESDTGVFNNRFVLVFKNQTLNTDDFEESQSGTIVSVSNKYLNVTSDVLIKAIKIYDISGRSVYEQKAVNDNFITLEDFLSTNNVLLIKILLDNNKTVIRKVIY
ncbi:putative delta-60 repeat protein [Flavobacterium sp. 28A]|uniref:T9SS sorting signal type C domain-containing protein n=1 Tax=Flavobacterium sp. 28A TaxID=2735895 RepID=UPI001D414F2C|nr:T9SS sorting signal type C domain-containing protein [Flavobacterium sp. 28A]NRT16272.1 putative delta-60 repeat protein [Flavobacterium sp. 28A]